MLSTIGFGDSCFQTQMMAFLASMYSDKPAAAFAIFKFIQSVGTAGAFAISSYTGLHIRLLILVSTCWLAAFTFTWVNCTVKRKLKEVHLTSENDITPFPKRNISDAGTNTSSVSLTVGLPLDSPPILQTIVVNSNKPSSSNSDATNLVGNIPE